MTTTMLRVLRTQRGAGGGSVVLLGAVATTAALNYGLGLALAWLLPTDGFGAVGVLLNLLLLATSVLAAGFPWALARATARGAGAGPDPAAVRSALVGNVVLGTVLAGALAAVQLTTGAVLPGVGPVPTLLAAATIVVLAVVAVLVGALQGARRFDGVGVARVTEIVVKVLAALGAVGLAGHGVGGVAAALLAAAVASALVAFAAAADRLRPSRPRPARGARSGVVAAAVPMAVSTTGFGLLGTLDVLALGAAGVPLAVVGVYQAAAVLARAPFFVGSALSDAAFPFIAAAPTAAAARRALLGALRWVPLVLVPGQLVLLVAPGPVLDVVLPGAYAGAAGPVRVLTLGTTGLLLADMLLKALFARGHAVAVARRVPVAVAAQVASLLVLVPAHGALGAAWAFTVGTWTTVALLGAVGLRGLRPTVPTPGAVRWGGAVAVLVVVLVLAAGLPTPAALAVVGAGLLAYALLVLPLLLVPHRPAPVTRATTPTEVTR